MQKRPGNQKTILAIAWCNYQALNMRVYIHAETQSDILLAIPNIT